MDKEQMDIRHKVSIVLDTRQSMFWSQQRLWVHIWFIMTLMDSATDIITKCDKSVLQNKSSLLLQILLQNATVVKKYKVYHQMRRCNLSKLCKVIKVKIILHHIVSFNIYEYPHCKQY